MYAVLGPAGLSAKGDPLASIRIVPTGEVTNYKFEDILASQSMLFYSECGDFSSRLERRSGHVLDYKHSQVICAARQKSWLRSVLLVAVMCGGAKLVAQAKPAPVQVDSDHDGMSDALEQALLVKFAPTFLIGERDCSNIPAEFETGVKTPHPKIENGMIYGQVFPAKNSSNAAPAAEIHYYHLWKKDCGNHGHPLDTEHVAVLVQASDTDLQNATWKARYWYAAAHENTVCDVSQIARASTLHAEDHGVKVWISPGKHASYLSEVLCRRGCGADRCEKMVALAQAGIINLGEVGAPMNGSVFIASSAWPLAEKMTHSNFPAGPIARLEALPDTDIAWSNAGRHPAQQIISISSAVRDATGQSIAGGEHNTTAAITVAGDSTGAALATAQDSTGTALGKSYRKTKHALGSSARHVGKALGITAKPDDKKPQ